jgi:curved DNA-binding protein CbpA
MTMASNFYKVLQVDPEAEPEVIRAAYVSLAKKYHPDMGLGAAHRMVKINEAWDVLGDPARRAAYDRAGLPWARQPVNPGWSTASAAETADAQPRRAHATSSTSSAIDFGRYAGWTLETIAREDPDYLDWLARAPVGRRFRTEIYALLAARESAANGLAARAQQRSQPTTHRGRTLGWSPPWVARASAGR